MSGQQREQERGVGQRSYALVLDNRPGAFLEASRVFSALGLDIVRMSYNKVVDVHTLFVDVEGAASALDKADECMVALGLSAGQASVGTVELVRFEVPSAPGALEPILQLVLDFGLDVTFVDGNARLRGRRLIDLGLYVDAPARLEAFLAQARRDGYAVTRIARDEAPGVLDNNLFYLGFSHELAAGFGLSATQEQTVLINANRIVQNLQRRGDDPFKPFGYLRQFADTLTRFGGEKYVANARVTEHSVAGVRLVCVEPPVGSTTYAFDIPDGPIFVVDCGYACYRAEFAQLMHDVFPDWDNRRRELFLTHSDPDHAGCCELFDVVYASSRTLEDFARQRAGKPGWRAQVLPFAPYVTITDVLHGFVPPALDGAPADGAPAVVDLGARADAADPTQVVATAATSSALAATAAGQLVCAAPGVPALARIGSGAGEPGLLEVGPFSFEVWEGLGGHIRGETVLLDRTHHVCVSGDILINVHGQTKVQRAFNLLSPYLMNSVDSVPDLAREERAFLLGQLDPGEWLVLGGHGGVLRHVVR